VKITSQDYDAEFGRAIGAIVTSQTKSGTNEIHGSAFDFERSNSNFASDPFSQTPSKIAAGQRQVPSGNWNQFGGTIGGPIRKIRSLPSEITRGNGLTWAGLHKIAS